MRTAQTATSASTLRDALASFPSGVTIVTTADRDDRWWGFTATSFSALSMEPPLVLVCLANDARCHPAFRAAGSWTVHVVPAERTDLALLFATRGADKFGTGDFTPDADGNPVLADSTATFACVTFARYDGGDHTIMVGRVVRATARDRTPVLYFRRGFHVPTRLAPPAE